MGCKVFVGLVLFVAMQASPAAANSSALCGCGEGIWSFTPYAPQVIHVHTPFGLTTALLCQLGGTKTIHHCDCIIGEENRNCAYTIELLEGSGSTDVQSGGCYWRRIGEEQELWCVDILCNGEGSEADPIMIEPHR